MNRLYVLRNKDGQYFCKGIDSSQWIDEWSKDCLMTYIHAKELDHFLGIETFIEEYEPDLPGIGGTKFEVILDEFNYSQPAFDVTLSNMVEDEKGFSYQLNLVDENETKAFNNALDLGLPITFNIKKD